MRIALGIEYDGCRYHGWQSQYGVPTVQDALERAVARVADHAVRIHCAGRTDTGVHASFQVAHFDTDAHRSERSWVLGTNSALPADVSVLWARAVPETFHARFGALRRAYEYVILNRATRPGLWRDKVTWACRPLNVEQMQEGARYWLGEHDFSSFRAKGCQARQPVRTVYRFDVFRRRSLIILRVEANAFLQHMVRNFAGVLMRIGEGQASAVWAREVLLFKSRALGGVTAPPSGLYLAGVYYPSDFRLPQPPASGPLLAGYPGRAFAGSPLDWEDSPLGE